MIWTWNSGNGTRKLFTYTPVSIVGILFVRKHSLVQVVQWINNSVHPSNVSVLCMAPGARKMTSGRGGHNCLMPTFDEQNVKKYHLPRKTRGKDWIQTNKMKMKANYRLQFCFYSCYEFIGNNFMIYHAWDKTLRGLERKKAEKSFPEQITWSE